MTTAIFRLEISLKLLKTSALENKKKMNSKSQESDQIKNSGNLCFIFRAIK